MKIELTIGSEKYTVDAIEVGEYLEILNSVKNENVSSVVRQLMYDKFGMNFPKHIAELLFIKLWSYSTGNVCIEEDYTLETGEVVKVPINMNFVTLSESKSEDDLIFDISGNLIKFRYPKLFEDNDYVEMVLNCIESVSVNDAIIKVDELTEQEMNELVSMIDENIFNDICNMLLEPKIYLIYSIGDENKILTGFRDIFNLVS